MSNGKQYGCYHCFGRYQTGPKGLDGVVIMVIANVMMNMIDGMLGYLSGAPS